jgi:hypothetical protein
MEGRFSAISPDPSVVLQVLRRTTSGAGSRGHSPEEQLRKPTLNGRKADAERETQPAIARPALAGLAQVLVEVIFETIERIREQDDTVLLVEQHALAAFEIADCLYVLEFGKLNMLDEAPRLLDESLCHRSQLGRANGESDRL